MKNDEIMQKIQGYKEKLVKMQMRLSKIEKKVQYKDVERFGFYKILVERDFDELDVMLLSLEANIENICAMVDGGCAFSELGDLDVESMMQEQVEYSEKHIKPVVREIEENLRKSVK